MPANQQDKFLLSKILATLGPASSDKSTILRLAQAGAHAFRINFSHGTLEQHEKTYRLIRECAEELGMPLGILGDLCGPKIRVNNLPPEGIQLKEGQILSFTTGTPKEGLACCGSDICLTSNFSEWINEIAEGEHALLDDGKIRLRCLGVTASGSDGLVRFEVEHGGKLTQGKGINLPETQLSLPALTDHDYQCVRFALQHDFDFLALSFVKDPEDTQALRRFIRREDPDPVIPIISKIERPQALDKLESIIQVSDGIMVARGDLGVEIDLARVPVIQKHILKLCKEFGKTAIVATQMLESMIQSPVPTRAEVSDVANAIFDGADAVMLSGETAVGQWPVEAVQVMSRIARRANEYQRSLPLSLNLPQKQIEARFGSAALAHGVCTVAADLDARFVILWCNHEKSAYDLSSYHLSRPVLAYSDQDSILQRLVLSYGLQPIRCEQPTGIGGFIRFVENDLNQKGYIRQGEPLVFILGYPITQVKVPTVIHIHYTGEPIPFGQP